MDSDSSSYYMTTYSADERIESELREEQRIRELEVVALDEARKQLFLNYANSDLHIFKLTGMEFHQFRHTKIKFSFCPKALTRFVNKNVRFFVSLRYRGSYWRVKRDSLPANYKWKVYRLFFSKHSFAVLDDNILTIIEEIHGILIKWTKQEEKFRLDKIERYKGDQDVELDTDDEEIFLSEAEQVELYQKRLKVLKRMLPPKSKLRNRS